MVLSLVWPCVHLVVAAVSQSDGLWLVESGHLLMLEYCMLVFAFVISLFVWFVELHFFL